MVVARRRARRGECVHRFRAWTLALLATFAVVAWVTPASATPSIQAKRQEANRVSAQISAAEHHLELKIEAYNRVHDDYLQTRQDLRRNRELLGVAKANLKQARSQLAASLTQAYKTGDQDVISYLLASRSFTDLISHMQVLEQATGANGQLVTTVSGYQKVITKAEKALAQQTAKLAAQQSQLASAKHQIERDISALQARKASISADIKRLIDAQARAQAQADAAAAAGATGGGGGGSIPIPPSGTLGGQAAAIAMQYLGTPYVWGGASPAGFDCSGLTMYVWGQLGVSLPHNAAAQYGMGTPVPMSALEPGDLVFFYGLGHVGIYVGNGAFVHAPHTGDVVKVSSLSGSYASSFVGARRVG
jgi:peptidoglycan DL-endopeptidase CwlO